jgi:hypothetical protein
MSDFNSSLPVRTENPGDVVVKLSDATTPSQQQAVNAAGSAQIAGQGIAGTPAGGVVSVQGVSGGTPLPISGSITITDPAEGPTGALPPSDAIYIGALASTSAPSLTTGYMYSPSLTLAGALRVDGSAVTQPISAASLPLPTGAATNSELITINSTLGSPFQAGGSIGNTAFGISGSLPAGSNIIGAVTQSGGPWTDNLTEVGGSAISLGQKTMAASLPVVIASDQSILLTSDKADGPAAPGAASSFSLLSGAIYNSSPISLTNGQQASLQSDSAGRLLVDGSQVTQPVSGTITANQGGAPWSQNITQISGASPSASNSLPVEISLGSSFISSSNPLPVILDPAGAGTPVMDFKDASAIAAGSSDNHDYTVTAGKTLHLQQIESSAAGKAKMTLEIETGVGTSIFTSMAVQFNSTATPDMSLIIQSPMLVAAGVRVRVVMLNRDNQADDLYSSIIGFEI